MPPLTQPETAVGLQPTSARYKVVALAVLLGMVTYLDRACIGKLTPNIMADLHLTKEQMSNVFSAFALSYALFALPTARWADRIGTRLLLAIIVTWWSLFTIGTAAAWGLTSLVVIRFLFGAGEAGAWPCVAKTFANWVPRKQRGTIQGIFFVGAHLTAGVTPLLVTFLEPHLSWRAIFVLFGLVGFLWVGIWYWWYRDTPAEHAGANAAERALIAAGKEAPLAVPPKGRDFWRTLLTNRNMLALCLMYLPNSFAFYFCITWLPTYLKEKHNFNAETLGILAGLPLILSVVGDLCGGLTTDWATAKFGIRTGRCAVGIGAYLVAGIALLVVPFCPQPVLAAVLLAVAVAASMFVLGAAWGTCLDISGPFAATVGATMNTSGQIGAIIAPQVVAYSLKYFNQNWNISIFVMSALFLTGAAGWLLIDPRKKIFESA